MREEGTAAAPGFRALWILLRNPRAVWCVPAVAGCGAWLASLYTGGEPNGTLWGLGAAGSTLAWMLVGLIVGGEPKAKARLLRGLALCVAPLAVNLAPAVYPLLVGMRGPTGMLRALSLGTCAALMVLQWGDRALRRPLECGRRLLAHPATIQVAVGAWGVLFTVVTVMRWWRLQHRSHDLAIFEQALYNSLHGHFLQYTCDWRLGDVPVHRFADHFEPVLLLLLPLYALYQTPVWLLASQAAVLASGAVPVRGLALRMGSGPATATLLGLAYLLHPAIVAAVLDEYHPSTMGGPFVLWGLHLLLSGRPVGGWLAMILALACKENLPGTVCMAGLYVAWRGRWKSGLGLAGFSVVWGVLALKVIIPHFSPTGAGLYWEVLGPKSPSGNVPGVLSHAGYVAGRITYPCDLLGPVGAVSLLGPAGLMVSVPEALLHWFSRIPGMRHLLLHYHVEIAVGVMLGAAEGLGRLRRWLARRRPEVAGAAVGLAFAVAAVTYCPAGSFLQPGRTVAAALTWPTADQLAVHRLLRQIPDGAPVLVNAGNLAGQLARRQRLYVHLQGGYAGPEVMRGVEGVSYVAIDAPLTATDCRQLEAQYGLDSLGSVGTIHVWRVRGKGAGAAR